MKKDTYDWIRNIYDLTEVLGSMKERMDFMATNPDWSDAISGANLKGTVVYEENKWQPIETAPKDGTPMLGYDGHMITAVRWNTTYDYWELVVPGINVDDDEWVPVMWMPLPEPPGKE